MSRISLHSKVLLANWKWIWMSKLLQLIGKCKICQSYQGPVIHVGVIATICHHSCLPTIFLCKFHCHKLYPCLTSSFAIAFCSMSFWGACHNTWEEEERCCTFGSLTVCNGGRSQCQGGKGVHHTQKLDDLNPSVTGLSLQTLLLCLPFNIFMRSSVGSRSSGIHV